jgi:glycosyltransferase involved in cell wall biosynthesis
MPGVLMVIGAYYPEVSGGGVVCRDIVRRLSDRMQFTVLTTTADPCLRKDDEVDGVPVYRVCVDPRRAWSKVCAGIRMAQTFRRTRHRFSIVHLHGFSRKSILMVALARFFGKRILITLTSVGHDDPISMRQRGAFTYWSYSRADVFAGISPRFRPLYEASALPAARFRLITNAVNTRRFCPVDADGQRRVRHELGLPVDNPITVFVGFFSHEKGPDLAFAAFARVSDRFPDSRLVLIGATRSNYYEIDTALAHEIRREAAERCLDERVIFVESTLEIHKYLQAADVFMLTSTREGLPVALLEAMSCGLGCIATRLEGITDILITDGVSGRLVESGDLDGFDTALGFMLANPDARTAMGTQARETVVGHFGVEGMVEAYFDTYSALHVCARA